MAFEVITRISDRSAPEFQRMVDPIEDRYPGSGRNLKWVLMALANYSNKEGFCWPSVGSIEDYSGLTTRSVQRSIKQAEILGLLKVRRRTNASSYYIFNLEKLPYVEKTSRPKERGPHHELVDWDEPDLFAGQPESADIDMRGMLGRHDGTPARDDIDPRQAGTPPPPVSAMTPASVAPKPVIEPLLEPSEEPKGTETAPANITLPLRQYVVDEWARLKAELGDHVASLRTMTDSMLKLAQTQARLHAVDGETDQEVWRKVFEEIRKSRFLSGRAPPGHGRATSFRLSFSRLVKPHIFREVINEGYADTAADNGNFDPVTGEILGPARAATSATIARVQSARQRQPGGRGPPSARRA